MHLHVAVDRPVAPLPRLWASTGFTPARRILDEDMQLNLAYLGSIPHRGVRHCRVHSLLDLLRLAGRDSERPSYDWSRLDRALDELMANGMRPFFELMGNPSGAFTDFTEPVQQRSWRRLCCDLALHLIERYGQGEVRRWHFECWNEPDIPYLRQPGHLLHRKEACFAYFDACVAGIKDADPELRIGGPGTAIGPHQFFEDFLDHCDHGDNAFGGQGTPIDFVSFHVKSKWAGNEQIDPDGRALLRKTTRHIELIRQRPKLAQLPIYDDECDPSGPWNRHMLWRPRSYYAALIVRFLDLQLRHVIDGLGADLRLISNDNGFLGPWGYRTLLARFGDEQAVADGRCELVKKPVFNAMVLLSLLGDQRLPVDGGDDECNAIATRIGDAQVAVLLYHHRDEIMSCSRRTVELSLRGLPFEAATLTCYSIVPHDAHDVFAIWERERVDEGISADGLAQIRAVQDIALSQEPAAVPCADGAWVGEVELPQNGLQLLLFSRDPGTPPAAVEEPQLRRYHGLFDQENILISWPGSSSRMLRGYEVACAAEPDGPWERLNQGDLLCTAFLHARAAVPRAWYRVRAVDYWGRAGAWSPVVNG